MRLYSSKELIKLLGVNKDFITKSLQKNDFPQPIILQINKFRWKEEDIMNWVNSKQRGMS